MACIAMCFVLKTLELFFCTPEIVDFLPNMRRREFVVRLLSYPDEEFMVHKRVGWGVDMRVHVSMFDKLFYFHRISPRVNFMSTSCAPHFSHLVLR